MSPSIAPCKVNSLRFNDTNDFASIQSFGMKPKRSGSNETETLSLPVIGIPPLILAACSPAK